MAFPFRFPRRDQRCQPSRDTVRMGSGGQISYIHVSRSGEKYPLPAHLSQSDPSSPVTSKTAGEVRSTGCNEFESAQDRTLSGTSPSWF